MQSKNSALTFVIIIVLIILAGVGIYFAKNKVGQNKSAGTDQSADNSGQVAGSSTTDQNSFGPNARQTDIILFYGNTCPHCKKVEDFINQNGIRDKIIFQNLEVYDNKANQSLMLQKFDLCKDLQPSDKGGVPFLYSSEKCVVGDTPVIDYLKGKAS